MHKSMMPGSETVRGRAKVREREDRSHLFCFRLCLHYIRAQELADKKDREIESLHYNSLSELPKARRGDRFELSVTPVLSVCNCPGL